MLVSVAGGVGLIVVVVVVVLRTCLQLQPLLANSLFCVELTSKNSN